MPTAKHHAIAIHTFQRNHPAKQDGEEDGKSSNSVCVRDCKRSYPCKWSYDTYDTQSPTWHNPVSYWREALRACPHAANDAIVVAKRALNKLFFLFHKTSSSQVNVCRRCVINCCFRFCCGRVFGGFSTLKIWMITILQDYWSRVNRQISIRLPVRRWPAPLGFTCQRQASPKVRLLRFNAVRRSLMKQIFTQELWLRAAYRFQ